MPKIVDHDQKRIEILENSLTIFATHGYAKISMRQLANELHVTTGSLYHYFQSKDALFESLLRYLQNKQITTIVQQVANITDNTNKLHLLFDFLESEKKQLCQMLQIIMDYQQIHPDCSQKTLVQGYKLALEHYFLLTPETSQLFLSVIFGTLVHNIVGIDISLISVLEQLPISIPHEK